MNRKGTWIPTTKSRFPNYRSYHFSGISVKSWKIVVRQFLEAGRDPNKLQVFYNSVLGEPFEDTTVGVDPTIVHNKIKSYANNILTDDVLFLVAAADIQHNRIECEIKAYGDRLRSWGIDHRIFLGDTANENDPCWQELASVIDEVWVKPNGKKLYVERLGVDSGDQTQLVYQFCEKFGGKDGYIIPLKGFESSIKTRDKFKLAQIKGLGINLLEIYVDLYKNQLSRYLNQEWREDENYPDGYMDFAGTYTEEYIRQLTTEKKVKERTAGGLTRIKWQQFGRNEAFDLNVYCLALAELTIWLVSMDELDLEQADQKAVFEYLKEQA
jgi:phage terminase large subunit GpA-like protein